MQTITFYAYKGGTGRTLALANAAIYLSRLQQKVFAIDLDLEAPGLHHKLALSPGGSLPPIKHGIVDYIYSFVTERKISEKLAPYTITVPREEERDGPITLMPAGNVLSASYWRQLARLDWHKLFYSEGAEGVPFFLELQEQIKAEFSPDFLLIDARTGITEVGGVATTLLPDQVVCLLLNNRENLEGAREVLRGIKRASAERKKPIGIVPVLSRLPIIPRPIDPEREQQIIDEVRAFLCQPAKGNHTSLDFASIFVLHAEESLAYAETLRIGGKKTVDESPLLRDYLHLFAQIIPSEQVEPHLDRLIDAATKDKLMENPERVQSDLEALAVYCPHPTSYLALLKFYRLRNAPATTILQTAVRFWEVSHRANHPLLHAVVRDYYRTDKRSFEENIPAVGKFAFAVWESNPDRDSDVGLRIADHALRFKRKDIALNVITQLLAGAKERPEIVVPCITRLLSAGEQNLAQSVIEIWSAKLGDQSDFQVAWASVVVAANNQTAAQNLFESDSFRPALILAKAPQVYVRLLKLAGRKEELDAALSNILDRSLGSKDLIDIRSTGDLFAEFGQSDLFRKRIEESLPDPDARNILRAFSRSKLQSRYRAAGYEIEF